MIASSSGRASALYFAMSAEWFVNTSKMSLTTSALFAFTFRLLVADIFSRRNISFAFASGSTAFSTFASDTIGK